MTWNNPRLIGLLTVVLVASACALMVAHNLGPPPASNEHAEALQRLVGGLGCGPAVDLSQCAFSFDPRLCPDCPQNHGPVPGGICFCPQHACSILYCGR